ncbi:MAG: ABC transporter ATP-binding protein, partial [Candidatus Kuenenia sp.]|nr:ABC transporter ATP-binding protein [Candidatus Kuenenia sp.]
MLVVNLQKKWHSFQLDVAFKIPSGEVTVLFGPSGAGKSSILRLVSGLSTADNGSIQNGNDVWFDKQNNINLPPQYRSVGFVFQDYALFPHLTVEKNVLYGAKKRHEGDKVKDLLALVGLSGYERYYPSQLSGGQKQRIALIRALAREPDILLMDEPLSAVDWQTRRQLQDDLKRILRQLKVTTLYVTHDIPETYKMADNVVVIHSGS